MRNRVTGFILPIVFALLLVGPVAAQDTTLVFSEDFMATQSALEAAVDRLPQTDQLFTPVTPVPTPTVIEIPEGGADVTDTGDVIVIVQKQDEGKNVVIIALFALVIALLAVVVWQADRLRVMIPAPLVPVLEKGADVGLEFGDKLVKATPGTVDDSLLNLIRDLKESFFEALRRTPPAETPTPDTTTVTAPAGSTTVISPPATPFADPRPITTPSGSPLSFPQAPSAEEAERIARERQAAGAVAVDAGYDENTEAVG